MANLGAMGSQTGLLAGITGCNTTTAELIVTPRTLPSSVWLQNAVCNGVNTAQITLMTARTDLSTSVAPGTAFTWIVVP